MTLEWRCRAFKKKVDQRLMIADVQIQQLNDYLSSLQAQLTELTDKRARFENQYQQKLELKEGIKKKRMLVEKARLAQLDSEQQQRVKEMQNQQARTIELMQADFDKSLSQIQNIDKVQMKQIEKRYSTIISDLENKLEKLENESRIGEEEEEEVVVEDKNLFIMDEQIIELQQLIKEKQEERAHNLITSKDKLLECVRALEENEEEHRVKMDDLKQQLCNDEEEYYEKVMRIKEKSKTILPPMKKSLKNNEKKFKELKQKIETFKSNSDESLKKLSMKSDTLRDTLTRVSKTSHRIAPKVSIVDVTAKTNELAAKIKERESELMWEQNTNNLLKQEICKLQFAKQTIYRRRSLKL